MRSTLGWRATTSASCRQLRSSRAMRSMWPMPVGNGGWWSGHDPVLAPTRRSLFSSSRCGRRATRLEVPELKAVKEEGSVHPGLSVFASLAFAVGVLAVAAYESPATWITDDRHPAPSGTRNARQPTRYRVGWLVWYRVISPQRGRLARLEDGDLEGRPAVLRRERLGRWRHGISGATGVGVTTAASGAAIAVGRWRPPGWRAASASRVKMSSTTAAGGAAGAEAGAGAGGATGAGRRRRRERRCLRGRPAARAAGGCGGRPRRA